ncbi:phosphatidylinositol-binding protein SCS2, partial [Ascoidea rubescens DSM 1968]
MEISPSILQFSPPFTQSSTQKISLQNNSSTPLAFKVKTTAPKLYCVRPNASTVNPGQQVEISIILQGLKKEPSLDYKCKDKFLIISLPCPSDEINHDDLEGGVAKVWPKLESQFKGQIVQKKIRVHYNLSQ